MFFMQVRKRGDGGKGRWYRDWRHGRGALFGGGRSHTDTGTVHVEGNSFQPTDLTGLQVWLDVSDLSTMFQEIGSETTQAVVNGPVGRILDKSSNGYIAVAASDDRRPILRQSGDLRYLEFDGVDDLLQIDGSAYSIPQPNVFCLGAQIPSSGRALDGSVNKKRAIHEAANNNRIRFYAGSWSAYVAGRSDTDAQVFTTKWEGPISYARINGTQTSFSAGNNTLQGLTVGASFAGSPSAIKFYGVVVNNGDLSLEETGNLEAYMAGLCGVSL